jgi:hypothetical protein
MNAGEILTKFTVWVALTCYALACAGMLRGSRSSRNRGVWTLGCGIFLAHVACAFGFYHDWSHTDAYRETARQTEAMTGMDWGGGLYFNYLFAALWLGDVLWWWIAPLGRAGRPGWANHLFHGFVFFLVFNGAFVFVRGAMRWYGLLLCLVLAGLWGQKRWLTARLRSAN